MREMQKKRNYEENIFMDCFIFNSLAGRGRVELQSRLHCRDFQTVMFFDMNIIYILRKYH